MGTEQSGMLGSVALASTGSLLAPAPTAAAPRPNACPRFELTTCVCNVCVCVSALSRVSTDAQQRAAIDREPQYKSNRGSAVCHSAAKHATNLSEFVQGPRWSDSKMFSAERVSTEGDGCVRLG